MEKVKIPGYLKRLFWSYDFESLSLEKDKRLIVKQILSYGTIEDWKWLVSVYGKKEVQKVIKSLYESEFRVETLKLIQRLFDCKPLHASRSIG